MLSMIHNQICGLIIVIMILYMFFRQKRLGMRSEMLFFQFIFVVFGCLSLDILSILAIKNSSLLPPLLLAIICKSYLVSLILEAYMTICYTMLGKFDWRSYQKYAKFLGLVTFAGSILIYALPINYYLDERSVYTYGPSVLCTYLFAVGYVLAALFLNLYKRSLLDRKRRYAALLWLAAWIFAALIQFLHNEYLVVGFASAIGLLAMYCILENPENNFNRELSCYRSHILNAYLEELFSFGNASRSLLFLVFLPSQRQKYENSFMIDCIHRLVRHFDWNKQVKIFSPSSSKVVLLFPSEEKMNDALKQIQTHFYFSQFSIHNEDRETGEFPESLFISVPDTSIYHDSEEIFSVVQAVEAEHFNQVNSLVYPITEEVLSSYRKNNEILEEVLTALEEDRIEVFYQPLYAVGTMDFPSAEALVRIRRADGSLIRPDLFIPAIEASGLILQVGNRVFEKVCKLMWEQHLDQLGVKIIEVNLSVVQGEYRNLAHHFIETMEKYGIDPSRINLEITETGTRHDDAALENNMELLLKEGVSFSLDDFGKGMSNLDYMIHMPVSVIKLDMSLTQAYFHDEKAKIVVESAIALARQLHLKIVVEGIETKEQFEAITARNVDFIQGYYFSKPLPQEEFLTFLKERNHSF